MRKRHRLGAAHQPGIERDDVEAVKAAVAGVKVAVKRDRRRARGSTRCSRGHARGVGGRERSGGHDQRSIGCARSMVPLGVMSAAESLDLRNERGRSVLPHFTRGEQDRVRSASRPPRWCRIDRGRPPTLAEMVQAPGRFGVHGR